MTEERRIDNVVGISDTLWKLNHNKVIKQIEQVSHGEVPEDCYKLIECAFRFGAVMMERAIGGPR